MIERKITVKEAAISLGLSSRQILRLKRRVREFGAGTLIPKNTDSRPHHKIEDSLKDKNNTPKRSPIYSNANFCHFQELLEEYEHIKISYSAIYVLLKNDSIVSPKKCRRLRIHHRRRRKGQEGLLVRCSNLSVSHLAIALSGDLTPG